MDKSCLTVATAPCGKHIFRIKSFAIKDDADRRLLDLGFVDGTEISVLSVAPLGSTFAVLLRGAVLCIRRGQAERICLEKVR